jgi:RNA polymerase sigma factor (sigma-70 family)
VGIGTGDDRHDPAEESFTLAFDELYPIAVRLAARLLGDQASAEDVASEAMARTYARWAKVSTLPYRNAWVLRVTGNLAIDALRRSEPRGVPPLAQHFEDASAVRMALASALRKLPARQREAVVLRYIGGYSEVEVSAALGISTNSVKKHVQRGLAALRGRLHDAEGDRIAAL